MSHLFESAACFVLLSAVGFSQMPSWIFGGSAPVRLGPATIFLKARPGVLVLLVCLCLSAPAQTGEWTWMSGSSTGNSIGVYGTLGTPAAGIFPGARAGAVSWTDGSGNFWLFGGNGPDAKGIPGSFNDLWEFNPSTKQWAWISGGNSPNQPGVYGTLGTPGSSNTPGGREGAVGWTDSSGNFWLFGGFGYYSDPKYGLESGPLNDLWKFSPSTNEWAWMGGPRTGNQPGVYGTLGTPAAGNIPGGRYGATSSTDGSDHFWLFGGQGLPANGSESLFSDLWEFNPSTNEWTWMGGSSTVSWWAGGSTLGQPGVYGTLGVPASGNTPGARSGAQSWIDGIGHFWLFGGGGLDANGHGGDLNDLWEFDPSTAEWAWMAGSSSVPSPTNGQPGVYGTLGTPAAGNIPGGRADPVSWIDSSGHLWLFGGNGWDANSNEGLLNDLWEFNPATNEWTWIGGSSTVGQPGVYGTLGTPAARGIPGGRLFASASTDSSGHLWLFGGDGLDANSNESLLNDLWMFPTSGIAPPAAVPVFSPAAGAYTSGQTVTISDPTPGATIYYTTNGTTPTTSSTVYSSAITVSTSATIEAIATANGYSSSAVASATYTINLPPTFTIAGTAVSVAPGAITENTSTVTVTPSNGFTGTVSLSCAITPRAASDPATCSLPASITISGSTAQTITLTVNTTAATSALDPARNLFWPSTGGAVLACLLLAGIPARRRRWQSILAVIVLSFLITGGVFACGGGRNGASGGGGRNPGTTPGTYAITVTGTSGAYTQTGTFSLTVQ